MNYPSHPHPHPHRRPAMPLVARVANAATTAYQRAMTSKRERLYQQENQRLREEVRRLRDEIGRRTEAEVDHLAREVEQAYLRGVASATVTAHAEQHRAVDEALARGFEAGRGVVGLSADGVGLTPEVIAAARAIARKLLGDVT